MPVGLEMENRLLEQIDKQLISKIPSMEIAQNSKNPTLRKKKRIKYMNT